MKGQGFLLLLDLKTYRNACRCSLCGKSAGFLQRVVLRQQRSKTASLKLDREDESTCIGHALPGHRVTWCIAATASHFSTVAQTKTISRCDVKHGLQAARHHTSGASLGISISPRRSLRLGGELHATQYAVTPLPFFSFQFVDAAPFLSTSQDCTSALAGSLASC